MTRDVTHVLVLGGTGEARQLADRLAGRPGVRVVSSLAGRTGAPRLPGGAVRIGGFGGPDGLAGWLRAERISAVIDATHPFAEQITAAAVAATGEVGIPLLVLRRPGWRAEPGDDWRPVPSLPAAAELLAGRPELGERVFLGVGRQGIAAFAGLAGHWFLARCVEPPEPPLPPRLSVVTGRGPYTVDGELDLLRRNAIDVMVSRDSGGAQTAAKLVAARRLGIPVLLVSRPALPEGVTVVPTVEDAVTWLTR